MSDFRMPDLNKVYLAGRLTRDPELRHLGSGSCVCTMSLAVSHTYKDKPGEKREDTLFVNVNSWNKQAEYSSKYLKKGYPVLVEGSLKSDAWEDKNTGQKRTAIKVQAQRVQQLDWNDANVPATNEPRPDGHAPETSEDQDALLMAAQEDDE